MSGDVFTGAGYAPVLLNVGSSTNFLGQGLSFSGSGYYDAEFSGTSGVIENSTFNATGATFGLQIAGASATAQMVSQNNVIFGEVAGNAYGAALNVGSWSSSHGDTVYNSDIGVSVYGTNALATGDTIYGDLLSSGSPGISAAIGILVSSGGIATGNTIYGNTTGAVIDGSNTIFDNNTLYGNTDAIQVGRYSYSNTHVIDNNTIVQSGGWALNLATSSASATTFEDNILSLTNAVGIVAPAADQTGFVSDYNLWDLGTGATLSTWSGQGFATLNLFKTDIGLDLNSFTATPGFNNSSANDYTLQAGSPAINRGNPALAFFLEPLANGGRIDIGARGGTALANVSPADVVQLLGQTGGQRYQIGQTATIAYTSAGLAASTPLLQIVTGNEGVVQGADAANIWQAQGYTASSPSYYLNAATVAANGLNIPQAVLQTYAQFYGGTGAYALPVPAGTYQISLVFAEPSATAAGQRTFNVIANGVTEAANYDIYKMAGGANKAVELTFTVNVGASGLNLQLVGTNGYPILNGISISTANAVTAPWTASAQVSYDNGATWTTVASGLSFDAYGAGSFSFTPTQTTTQGLLQIVAANGSQTVTDTSLGAFMSVPAGNQFYVSTTGSDLNSGLSPNAPMASVAGLLNVYKMQAGDVINVAAGTYNLPTAINLGASDSGAARRSARHRRRRRLDRVQGFDHGRAVRTCSISPAPMM